MNTETKFSIAEIKYLLKKYPYMKSRGIYKSVTEIIEKCLEAADDDTRTLAESIYFNGKSIVSMQFEVYLSESQILRRLNTLNKNILIECILSKRIKIFKTAYTKLKKEN